MTLIKAHALTRKKLKGEFWRSCPVLTFEETGTSFQCAVIMDAREMGLIWLNSKGFQLRQELAEMDAWEFLDYIKTK